MFTNISLIVDKLWRFGMSVIKLYMTLYGKFITILDTVKVCAEDWYFSEKKLHFIWAKYGKDIITYVRNKKR